MSEKRTRISLAQKLDIIEASKKSGFSIEDVMKKYGLKKSTVYRLLAEKEFEETNELDKCFYEPASIIVVVTPCKRKRK